MNFYKKINHSDLFWINQNEPKGFGDAVKYSQQFIGNDDFSQDMCNLILAFAPIWNDNKSFSLYSDQIETAKPTDVKIENPQNVVWNRHGEK